MTESPEKIWKAATTKAWEKIRASPSTSLHQFIVSISSDTSGYARRQTLLSLASSAGEISSFSLVEYPISNSREKTSFLLASTLNTIQTIAIAGSDGIQIQPYLSMMKIRTGTIDQMRSGFGSGLCIIASFGPSAAADVERDDAFVEDIKQNLRQLTTNDVGVRIKETFPKTSYELTAVELSSTLACLSKALLDSPDGPLQFIFGSLATFDAAVSFVAALASLPDVNSIEIQGEILLM